MNISINVCRRVPVPSRRRSFPGRGESMAGLPPQRPTRRLHKPATGISWPHRTPCPQPGPPTGTLVPGAGPGVYTDLSFNPHSSPRGRSLGCPILQRRKQDQSVVGSHAAPVPASKRRAQMQGQTWNERCQPSLPAGSFASGFNRIRISNGKTTAIMRKISEIANYQINIQNLLALVHINKFQFEDVMGEKMLL